MDIINDKYLTEAREFIQDGDDVKNGFFEYYRGLDADNAKAVHDEVYKTYSDVLMAIPVINYSSKLFLFGLILSLLGLIGAKFTSKNTKIYDISEMFSLAGLLLVITSFMTFMMFVFIEILTYILMPGH